MIYFKIILIFYLLKIGTCFGGPQNPQVVNEYYSIVSGGRRDSIKTQIEKLENFLIRYPNFEISYQKLFKFYTLEGMNGEAIKFFELLSQKESCKEYSHWMLAKLYALENNHKKARIYFEGSYRKLTLSPNLLKDIYDYNIKFYKQVTSTQSPRESEKQNNKVLLARVIGYFKESKYREAEHIFSLLPKFISSKPDILYDWGKSCYYLTKYNKADSLFNSGLDRARVLSDLETKSKFFIMFSLMPNTPVERKMANLDSAYTIAKNAGDARIMAYVSGNKGIIYRRQGEYERADEYFREAISICRNQNSEKDLAVWLSQHGTLLEFLGKYDEALRIYDQSEWYAQISKNQKIVMNSLRYKGRLYSQLKQYDIALKSFRKAIVKASLFGYLQIEKSILMQIADLYFQRGNYAAALKNYEVVLKANDEEAFIEDRLYCMIKTGRIMIFQEKYDLAQETLKKAIQIALDNNLDDNERWANVYLAETYKRSEKLNEAKERYSYCLESATVKNDSALLIESLKGLGDLSQQGGYLEEAIVYYEKSAHIVERTRSRLRNEIFRIEFFADATSIYDELIYCHYLRYLKAKEFYVLDDLFYLLDKTNSRTLLEERLQDKTSYGVANRKSVESYQQSCEKLRMEQKQLRSGAFTFTWKRIDSTLAKINAVRLSLLENRLKVLSLASNIQINERKQINLNELIELAKAKKSTILLYELGEKCAFVFVVTDTIAKLIPLEINREKVKQAIQNLVVPFHKVTEKNVKNIPFNAEISYDLYCTLFKPIIDSLSLKKNIVIVPTAELSILPFEMLLYEKPIQKTYDPTDYPTYAKSFLLKKYNFAYVPSVQFLNTKTDWKFTAPSLLVFANPINSKSLQGTTKLLQNSRMRDFGLRTGWRLLPLPNSEIEATEIKNIYSDTEIKKRDEASKNYFLTHANRYDIVHLSTHAFADTSSDAFSGLVFAMDDNPTDDGLLMGYEISDLKLNCDLLTLSACETGRGRYVAGEGVLGLPRLFMGAGVKSVIMTHWKVDDFFASTLMPEFYRYYLDENKSKIESLSAAKRAIILENQDVEGIYYQHPFYWAAFTIYGDPDLNNYNFYKLNKLIVLLGLVLIATTILYFRKRRNQF